MREKDFTDVDWERTGSNHASAGYGWSSPDPSIKYWSASSILRSIRNTALVITASLTLITSAVWTHNRELERDLFTEELRTADVLVNVPPQKHLPFTSTPGSPEGYTLGLFDTDGNGYADKIMLEDRWLGLQRTFTEGDRDFNRHLTDANKQLSRNYRAQNTPNA